jgi:hypothetical protein
MDKLSYQQMEHPLNLAIYTHIFECRQEVGATSKGRTLLFI